MSCFRGSLALPIWVALLCLGFTMPAEAQKKLGEGLDDLASQIGSILAKDTGRKIAVLPFRELDGSPSYLGAFISEQLVTDLLQLGERDVVERAMLDRLLGELKLDASGFIDPEMAKKVGKIAGVDAIVSGTVTSFKTYVALNCRLIEAQTGRVFGAADAKILKDADLLAVLGAPLSGLPDSRTSGSTHPERSEKLTQEIDDFLITLTRVQLSGNTLRASFQVMNRSSEDRDLYFFGPRSFLGGQSRLIADGQEYEATSIRVGNTATSNVVGKRYPPGVPLEGEVVFEGVRASLRASAVLELGHSYSGMRPGGVIRFQIEKLQ